MKSEHEETTAFLLTHVAQHGYILTADQLRRLHLEDMIARPFQDHPEGKVGSETVYPSGTHKLLLAICSASTQKRSFSAITWQLWWEGHPIPPIRIRAELRKTAEGWGRMCRRLCLPGTGRLSRVALKLLGQVVSYRFREPFITQARKRVGTVSFDTFTRILLEVSAGRFSGFVDDGAGSAGEEQEIMERGFGLRRTAFDSRRHVDWTANLEHTLVELSELIASNPWIINLEQASDNDLLHHRDELRLLLSAFSSMSDAMNEVAGKHFFGGSMLYHALGRIGQKQLPFLLLIWVTLRRRMLMQTNELLQAARQWQMEGEPAFLALRLLQVEVPATRSLLEPRRRKALIQSKPEHARYLTELRTFYEQHQDELMAFWQRHPEWYSPNTTNQ